MGLLRAVYCSSIIAGLFFLHMSCISMAPSESTSIGGSGSEVVGVVEYPESTTVEKSTIHKKYKANPLIGCNVFVYPESYLADTGVTEEQAVATTSGDGSFRISNVMPGRHFVYVKDGAGKGVMHLITVPAEPTTIHCGVLKARENASVQIQYSGKQDDVLFYVNVRGTGTTIRCTQRGVYANYGDIPTGINFESNIITVRVFRPFKVGFDKEFHLIPGQNMTLDNIID